MFEIHATTTLKEYYLDGVGCLHQQFIAVNVEDAKEQMLEAGYYDPEDFVFTIVGDYTPSPTTWRDYHNKTVYAR